MAYKKKTGKQRIGLFLLNMSSYELYIYAPFVKSLQSCPTVFPPSPSPTQNTNYVSYTG